MLGANGPRRRVGLSVRSTPLEVGESGEYFDVAGVPMRGAEAGQESLGPCPQLVPLFDRLFPAERREVVGRHRRRVRRSFGAEHPGQRVYALGAEVFAGVSVPGGRSVIATYLASSAAIRSRTRGS
jgi:hypothetical protein